MVVAVSAYNIVGKPHLKMRFNEGDVANFSLNTFKQ